MTPSMTPDQLLAFTKEELCNLAFARATEDEATNAMTTILLNMRLMEDGNILNKWDDEKKEMLESGVKSYTSLFETNFQKPALRKATETAEWFAETLRY